MLTIKNPIKIDKSVELKTLYEEECFRYDGEYYQVMADETTQDGTIMCYAFEVASSHPFAKETKVLPSKLVIQENPDASD